MKFFFVILAICLIGTYAAVIDGVPVHTVYDIDHHRAKRQYYYNYGYGMPMGMLGIGGCGIFGCHGVGLFG